MNQCVPSWDIDEIPLSPRQNTHAHESKSNSLTVDVPTLDYEVAELTWKNGQLAMHGLALRRVPEKPTTNKYTWEKPCAGGGTLESLVDQATTHLHREPALDSCGGSGDELVPWFKVLPSATTALDTTSMAAALVPCTNSTTTKHSQGPSRHMLESVPGNSTRVGGCSTRVESCSGLSDTHTNFTRTETSVNHSVRQSATWGKDSYQVTFDTCTAGFTSTSMGSPENTSSAKQWTKNTDDHYSVCHDKTQAEVGDGKEKKKGKCPISIKRGRAAAIHNQSERKRRDKINQRMKTLQKLIPNSNKTDKASILDEVIEYLKQLQAQIQMMRGMNMSFMMLPMAMQQQLQMSMMAPMGMGMAAAGMGMGMGVIDMNTMAGRANVSRIPHVLHPSAYMPTTSWDGATGDRLPTQIPAMSDPLSAFFACQSQPMTMDAYTRMATLYQQFQQPPGPSTKN